MAEISSLPNGGDLLAADQVFVTRGGVSYRAQMSIITTIAAQSASATSSASAASVSAAAALVSETNAASAATTAANIAAPIAAAAAVSGTQTIYIPAAAIAPSASVGCASLTIVASGTNQPDIRSLDFNTTTQQYAQFDVAFPKSWDEGTVTAKFFWSHAATTTNFGVVWNLQGVAISDDDTQAVAYGTAQQVADTGGTTNDLYVTAATSAITIAGTPAVGDMVNFRVSRVTADGSDTMAIDARLMGIQLFWTNNAGNDN